MSNQKTVDLFSNIQQMGYILGDMNEDEYQDAARTLGQITLKYDGKLNEHMDHVEVFLQAIRDTNPTEGTMSNQTETVTDLTRIRFNLPEAWYYCQQVENGLITASNHPMHAEPNDGMYQDSELWYAHFDVQEYSSQYGGFWCSECLEKLKLPRGRSLFEHLTGKA